MQSIRLPRFERVSTVIPTALTQRDRETVRRVFQHRFLRSTHILSLLAGSRQQILRRLRLPYHQGYLDRPRAQVDYYRRGARAKVYGLGNKGMQLLEREDGLSRRKLDWTACNRSVTRYFMEHALAVADAMVALELPSRPHGIELLDYEPATTQPFKSSVPLRQSGSTAEVGVIPDRVFGLKTAAATRWFFLEADRATMPVERSNFKQSSFLRSLPVARLGARASSRTRFTMTGLFR